jgi:predicted dehydrogenase
VKKITIGIIGCGYWGPNFIRNFTKISGVNVKYVSDLNMRSLSIVTKNYPGILITTNYKKILLDSEVDAVVVATSAKTHYKLAKDSLLAGKHVLVEKPIATKITHAKDLISIADSGKKILMVGHTFKYNMGIRKLKYFIKSRIIGDVYYMYSIRTNLGPLRKDVNAIWDLAPHDISIVNFLLESKPLSVSAQGSRCLPHNLEDVSFINLWYPHNILVHVHVSWLDPKKTREIIVVGSKKMAVFNDLTVSAPISIYDKSVAMKGFKQRYSSFREFRTIVKSGKVITPKVNLKEPLEVECRHFIDCLKKNKLPLSDGEDGLNVLKALLAIDKSIAHNGKEVFISRS